MAGLMVLVVEDETMVALDIAQALTDAGASVLGPVGRVSEALVILDRQTVHAAVLDANLIDRDITPVVAVLVDRKKPLVLYTGTGLPEGLRHLKQILPLVLKPAPAEHVVDVLSHAVEAAARAPSAP